MAIRCCCVFPSSDRSRPLDCAYKNLCSFHIQTISPSCDNVKYSHKNHIAIGQNHVSSSCRILFTFYIYYDSQTETYVTSLQTFKKETVKKPPIIIKSIKMAAISKNVIYKNSMIVFFIYSGISIRQS